MKKVFTNHSSQQLTKYSAMAAVFLATADQTEAQIMYNDIEDITVELGDSLDYDLDGDGTLDFRFRADTLGAGEWTFGSLIGYVPSQGVGNSENAAIGYSGTFYYYASIIDEGDVIDGAAGFIPDGSYAFVLVSNFYGSEFGMFGDEGPQYVGFKFVSGENLHYGWMRLDVTLDPASITFMDFAYNASHEGAIQAGQTTEVGVLNMSDGPFQVFAHAKNLSVNTQQTLVGDAELEVVAVNGKVVFAQKLNAGTTQVNLNSVASGVYIAKISTKENVYSQKVLLQ